MMRFRKRIKVFPGFSLNFSSSGISSSIGVRGASITFSKKGTYLNTSIPALGLYSRQKLGGPSNQSNFIPEHFMQPAGEVTIVADLPGEIKSADRDSVTSSSMLEVRNTLKEAYEDRNKLNEEITYTERALGIAKVIYAIAFITLLALVFKYFKRSVEEKKEYLIDLKNQLHNCKVDIDIYLDSAFADKYQALSKSYERLLTADTIWDVTSQVKNDRVITRSAAEASITRRKVSFHFDQIDIIKSSYSAFHLENANGDDLYIYPAFAIITKNKTDFGLITLDELELTFESVRFMEQERIPADSMTVGETWAKVNKNGQPDRRFKDNYRIPIVKYGQLEFKTGKGLNEAYCVSNDKLSSEFADAFLAYRASIA